MHHRWNSPWVNCIGGASSPALLTRYTLSADQSIPSGTNTAIVYDTAVSTDGSVSYNSSTGLFTVNKAGIYQLSASAVWASSSSGARGLFISAGQGGDTYAYQQSSASTSSLTNANTVSTSVRFAAGAQFSFYVIQNSGAAVSLSASTSNRISAAIMWVGN